MTLYTSCQKTLKIVSNTVKLHPTRGRGLLALDPFSSEPSGLQHRTASKKKKVLTYLLVIGSTYQDLNFYCEHSVLDLFTCYW